jgi:hypothetical protein
MGVGLSDLSTPKDSLSDLFAEDDARSLAAERAADSIRARFGPAILNPARGLERKPRP